MEQPCNNGDGPLNPEKEEEVVPVIRSEEPVIEYNNISSTTKKKISSHFECTQLPSRVWL